MKTFLLVKHIRLRFPNNNKVFIRSAVDLAHKIHGKKGPSLPVICIHGLLGSKKNWESLCKKINEGTKKMVVAVDARNHGDSPHTKTHSYQELAADVSQLMKKLSISKATVIGHSMGGRTAMVLALTEPSKVAGLVPVDISPVSTPGILSDFFPKLMDVMKSVDFSKSQSIGKARVAAKKKIMASGLIQHEAGMGFVLMNIGTRSDKTIGWLCNIDTLKKNFVNIAKFPLAEMAGKKYPGPTFFIGGDQSDYLPAKDLPEIKKIFPQAKLTYVKGVGHNVHAEDSKTFLSLVIPFVKQQ